MASTHVRACSWTLQIPDPSREVVAGEQVSLELTDSSLVVWGYLLSPYGIVTLAALSTLQGWAVLILPSTLGSPPLSQPWP